jgi:hypothetical protein
LGFAVFGLMVVLIAGGFHAAGASRADLAVQLFFFVFLFPLVTGAISYLLPVWLWPARDTPGFANATQRLARGSGIRTLVFLLAGTMAWGGIAGAAYPAVAAVAVFLLQTIGAIWARFSKRI